MDDEVMGGHVMTGEEAKERARRIVVVDDVEVFTKTLYGGPFFLDNCPACGERTTDTVVCVQCGCFIRDSWPGKKEL